VTIQAMYELKRQGLLLGYSAGNGNVDPALAFAYEKRLAPIFHEGIMRESYDEDPFHDAYFVKSDFVAEVVKYIDECWLAKELEKVEFYKLEDKFGGYGSMRMELIHIIEYARISRRFDDEVYSAIESNAPVEANEIAAEFLPSEVYFG